MLQARAYTLRCAGRAAFTASLYAYSIRAAQSLLQVGLISGGSYRPHARALNLWMRSIQLFQDRISSDGSTALTNTSSQFVTLSQVTEPRALCTIFETLNRTGVKLQRV